MSSLELLVEGAVADPDPGREWRNPARWPRIDRSVRSDSPVRAVHHPKVAPWRPFRRVDGAEAGPSDPAEEGAGFGYVAEQGSIACAENAASRIQT